MLWSLSENIEKAVAELNRELHKDRAEPQDDIVRLGDAYPHGGSTAE